MEPRLWDTIGGEKRLVEEGVETTEEADEVEREMAHEHDVAAAEAADERYPY